MKKIIIVLFILLTMTLSACSSKGTTYKLVEMVHEELTTTVDQHYKYWKISFYDDGTYYWVEHRVDEKEKKEYSGKYQKIYSLIDGQHNGYRFEIEDWFVKDFYITETGLTHQYGWKFIFEKA